MTTRLVFLFLTISILFTSCEKVDKESLSGKWKVTKYKYLLTNSAGHENKNLERSIILTFEDDGESGTVSGHTVTNDFTASYTIDGNQISFNGMEGKETEEPAWGNKFWVAMALTHRFERSRKKLILTHSDGLEQVILKRED